jgi:hypothetical protein
MTAEQEKMRELWEQVRTRVLNHGNTQLRAAQNEIGNHIVKWNRYQLNMIVQPVEDEE